MNNKTTSNCVIWCFFLRMGAFFHAVAVLQMCLFLHFLPTFFASDVVTLPNLITDLSGETIVSAGAVFELGFFDPSSDQGATHSSISVRRYVGIWYYNTSPKVVVWVANRDSPLNDYTGRLVIVNENIRILDGEKNSYWSNGLTKTTSARIAKLSNTGNLVVEDVTSREIVWESFKNPSNTFLPSMEMNENLVLTSWKSLEDPSTGNFTFQMFQQDRYVIRKSSVPYWVSGKYGMYVPYNQLQPLAIKLLNVSQTSSGGYNVSVPVPVNYKYTRLVINSSGQIELYTGNLKLWSAPSDRCSIDNVCGNFGCCNVKNGLLCRCLPGYIPTSPDNWESGDFSGGCVQKSPSCAKNVIFLSLKMMKLKSLEAVDVRNGKSESDCENDCLQDCKCKAYSYSVTGTSIRNRNIKNDTSCWIWREELSDLQELYENDITLNVRIAVSDLGLTSRDCKPCGINTIPYPLSSGAECGDPSYMRFTCDDSTGQLSFQAKSEAFLVLSINITTGSFVIQVDTNSTRENCAAGFRDYRIQLDKSSPFHAIDFCYVQPGKLSMLRGRRYAEIGWDRPQEPLCTKFSDCVEWKNSSCLALQNGEKRCICNGDWDNVYINCIQDDGLPTNVPSFIPTRDKNRIGRRVSSLIKYGTVSAIAIAAALTCTMVLFIYKRKKRVARLRDGRRNLSLQLYDSETRAMRMISEDDKRSIEVPFFEFDSIKAATNSFSDDNKLGRGGFGPVYKGIFPGNRPLAIKMLASVSGQGLDEFKNEIVLISRLQHRNLVRLVGYCVTREEKMLLYEYMPNKSLDYFIFDRALSMQLNWGGRFNIIMGIARGLLYLHEDSRLKIIHRDLKLSNILLDEDLNPKISDFGLARIFGSKQTEAITGKVVGTYGYMSPEYALEGFFSVKSDVFSLGVMILEIISGRRNTGFYNSDQALSLLGFAWKLWTEHSAIDMIDKELLECCKIDEYMKSMKIGLLCVQEDPNDRPTMSNVVRLLGSEITNIPAPKQPAFVLARVFQSSTGSSSNNQKSNSSNKLTLSTIDGR